MQSTETSMILGIRSADAVRCKQGSGFLKSLAVVLLLIQFFAPGLIAGYRDTIGYNRLKEELGDSLPEGGSVPVAQIEWDDNYRVYAPDPGGELSGKNFIYPSHEPDGWFSHATNVAHRFYGKNTSIAPSVQTIYSYGVGSYTSEMKLWRSSPPSSGISPEWRVENHSWVGSYGSSDAELLRRIDYSILHNNIFISAGLNNGTGTMPPLLANFHNGMAVGVASGNHSRGGSTRETTGRVKPDIVVPIWSTSYATGVISSAATLLIDHANGSPLLSEAKNTPVLKALLMTGATNESLPDWSNTIDSPLDPVYGAGALNIYNSYHILDSGRHDGALAIDRKSGWDWNQVTRDQEIDYYFRVSTGVTADLSTTLSWNRNILHSPDYLKWFYTRDLLSLSLWECDNEGNPIQVVNLSESEVDNVGHIRDSLPAGDYVLQIEFREQGRLFIQNPTTTLTPQDFVDNGWEEQIDIRSEVPYGFAWQLDYDENSSAEDDHGDDIQISVDFIEPNDGESFHVGETIFPNLSVSGDTDQIEIIEFFANGVKISETGPGEYATEWAPHTEGEYVLLAKITDTEAKTFESDEITVSVLSGDGGSSDPLKAVPAGEYRYLRWEVSGRKGPANSIQISQFTLVSEGVQVEWPDQATASNPNGHNPGSEGSDNAIDGLMETKWLDFNFSEDDSSLSGSSELLIDLGESAAISFDGYSWATANDASNRDPVEWSLYGSSDAVNWTLLDTREDQSITEDRRTFTGNFGLSHYGEQDGNGGDESPSLPEHLISQDIGDAIAAGSAEYNPDNGFFTLNASGGDIWGRQDGFHFLHHRLAGDGAIVARIIEIDGNAPRAKAGIMIRESLDSDSPHVAIVSTPEQAVSFQRRLGTGEFTYDTSRWGTPSPVWVKLERKGDRIDSYYSQNGVDWELLETLTLGFSENIYVGLVLASEGQNSTARFDSVILPDYANPDFEIVQEEQISSIEPMGESTETADGESAFVEFASTGGSLNPVETDRFTLYLNRHGSLSEKVSVRYEISGAGAELIDPDTAPAFIEIPANAESGNFTLRTREGAFIPENTELTLQLLEDESYSLEMLSTVDFTLSKRPVDAWKAAHFTLPEQGDTEISGDQAIPAEDGVPNLLKYALGGAPRERLSDNQRPALTASNGLMALRFERPAGISDIRYIVEVSTDLDTWTPIPEEAIEIVPVTGTDRERVTARDLNPGSEKQRFLRLRVERR